MWSAILSTPTNSKIIDKLSNGLRRKNCYYQPVTFEKEIVLIFTFVLTIHLLKKFGNEVTLLENKRDFSISNFEKNLKNIYVDGVQYQFYSQYLSFIYISYYL